MAGLRALWDAASNAFQNTGLSKEGYLKRNGDNVIPEMRMSSMLYADPVSPCFKIFFDFSKPYGLFADEENQNSALAYLKRIFGTKSQESGFTRYDLLKSIISNIKILNQYYDFLFEEIEGLDQIITLAPEHVFDEKESKINVKIRETVDMRVFSLLSQLRHVMYDDERMVEILPENLRRFDIFVSVFPTGYYNNILYGINTLPKNEENTTIAIQHKILPTIDKLCDSKIYVQDENTNLIFEKNSFKDFNNIQFEIKDCYLNFEESGKDVFGSISNIDSELLKINFTFNFRFGSYSMLDNNLIEGSTIANAIGKDLQIASALNKATNVGELVRISSGIELKNPWERFNEDLKYNLEEGLKISENIIKNTFSEKYPIGNVYSKINGDFIKNTLKTTTQQGITKVEDYVYSKTVGRVERLIKENTRLNPKKIYDKIDIGLNSEFKTGSKIKISGTEKFETGKQIPINKSLSVDNEIGNIYKRRGF